MHHYTSCGVDSFEASATATVLLGSSKGVAASKVSTSKASTSASVSTAGNKRKETDVKKAESEMGHEG